MEWVRAKTIMIVFLIVVNIGLGAYILIDSINEKKVNDSIANKVIELLKENNISVKKDMILSNLNVKNENGVKAYNVVSDYFNFSKKIIGENVKSFEDGVYENNIGKVTFAGDCFKGEAREDYFLDEIVTNDKNAVNNAKKYLESIGVDVDTTVEKVEKKDNKFYVTFEKKVNNRKIFNMQITVEMSYKGVTAVWGNWYNREVEKTKYPIKDITGILIEYMNLKSDSGESIAIKDIDIGYVVFDSNIFHEDVKMELVWRITDSLGKTEYIRATA